MAKGSNNLRGRTSDASKPYDVSNSFVKRVASRVTELLPQPSSWFSRWMSPSSMPNASDFSGPPLSSAIISRPAATSRAELNLVDDVDHVPTKKARTSRFNSPVNQNKFLRRDVYTAEDISPIAVRGEPTAGPSNAHPEFIASTPAVPLHVPPQNVPKVNGDDCSETSESTSGCSSLVPQAQSTTHSLGGSRYGRLLPSGPNVDTLRRRGPSFSNVTFTSPLRASMRDRHGTSPFYSGRTMYGGASQAYMSVIHSPQKRVGPTVKPITSQQSLPLSSTAKRILDALEQFSTPVIDAKRMPVAIGTKRKMESSGYQRYSELSVPSTPDLLRVKRRERLQQSTSAARQTAATSSSQSSPEYSIRKEDTDKKKFTGKVKRKENVEDDIFVEVKLPSAVLSIDNLPKIDIAIPPPSATQSIAPCQLSVPNSKFSFANPTVVPHSGSVTSLPASIQTPSFKFSSPIVEQSCKTSVSDNTFTVNNSVSSLTRTSSGNSSSNCKKRLSNDENSLRTLMSDKSVNKMRSSIETPTSISTLTPTKSSKCKQCHSKVVSPDTLCMSCQKSQKLSDIGNVSCGKDDWECLSCKSKNLSTIQSCRVCQKQKSKQIETSKNNITSSNPVGFGNLYQKPVGTWECSTCMIQNKNEALKCIACESLKLAKDGNMTKTAISDSSTTLGFGDKFKQPSGSWECQVCMVSNKPDCSVCIACTTPKPGSEPNLSSTSKTSVDLKLPESNFGDKFKKAPGSWSCEICMITNDADKLKCAACENPKPGATLPKTLQSTASQFSFGIPASTTVNSSSSQFSFGINKSDQANISSNSNFTLPTKSVVDSTKATFSFGIPAAKTEHSSTNAISSTPSNSMFQFGSASSQVKSPETNILQESTDSSKQSFSGSIFGNIASVKKDISVSEAKSSITNTTTPSTVITTPGNTEVQLNTTFGIKNEKSDLEKTGTPKELFTFGTNKVTQSNNEKTDSTSLSTLPQPAFMFEAKKANYGSHIVSSTTSTISTSSSSNIFKFGETKSVPSGGETISISSINAQNNFTETKANNMFSLGSNSKKKEINFGLNSNHETTKVNTTSNATPTGESKPKFSPFITTTSHQPAFGNTTTFGTSTFGNKEQMLSPFTPQTTSNLFGTTETTNSSSTTTFSGFGQTSAFQPVAQENKPTSVFAFGSTSKEPPSDGFVFKPAIEKKQSEPVFGFSSNQSNPPFFAFGSNASSTPSTKFNFEPKPFPPTAVPFNNTPVAVFGAQNSQQPVPPAFGGQQQANSNPVFAFGSQQAQPTETPANPMFQFVPNQSSSTSVGPTPTSAFMFGTAPTNPTVAPAPSPAAPAFDPNVKPTFNFSQGSTPVFSAVPTVPSGTPAGQRKIRKAVRRTNISSNRQT